jgi:site-specific recombinase XerD
MKATLRSRKLKGGLIAWDVDIYPAPIIDGKPKRKWSTGIVTMDKPERSMSVDEKAAHRQLQTLLEQRRSAMYLKALTGELARTTKQITISDYMRKLMDASKRPASASSWLNAIKRVELSGIGNIPCDQLSVQDCTRFRDYLMASDLQQNSQRHYLTKFRVALRHACHADVIKADLTSKFKGIKSVRPKIDYLDHDELARLLAAPTGSGCRRAFEFCCMTGLRYSDMAAMKWENVFDMPGGTELRYTMQKTGKYHVLPISPKARAILDEPADEQHTSEKVEDAKQRLQAGHLFPEIPQRSSYNHGLSRWGERAGIIGKTISSHVARHTYASQRLSEGMPITVLRDMLGHASVKETEIYAELIPDLLRQHAWGIGMR